jgi:hypothetical protein
MADPIRPDVLEQVAHELNAIAVHATEEQGRVIEQLNAAELAVVLGTREIAARSLAPRFCQETARVARAVRCRHESTTISPTAVCAAVPAVAGPAPSSRESR